MRLHTYSIKSNVYAMEDEAAAEQNELCLMGCVRTVRAQTTWKNLFRVQKKKSFTSRKL